MLLLLEGGKTAIIYCHGKKQKKEGHSHRNCNRTNGGK